MVQAHLLASTLSNTNCDRTASKKNMTSRPRFDGKADPEQSTLSTDSEPARAVRLWARSKWSRAAVLDLPPPVGLRHKTFAPAFYNHHKIPNIRLGTPAYSRKSPMRRYIENRTTRTPDASDSSLRLLFESAARICTTSPALERT